MIFLGSSKSVPICKLRRRSSKFCAKLWRRLDQKQQQQQQHNQQQQQQHYQQQQQIVHNVVHVDIYNNVETKKTCWDSGVNIIGHFVSLAISKLTLDQWFLTFF